MNLGLKRIGLVRGFPEQILVCINRRAKKVVSSGLGHPRFEQSVSHQVLPVVIVQLGQRKQQVTPFISTSNLMQFAQGLIGVLIETIQEIKSMQHKSCGVAVRPAGQDTGVGGFVSLMERTLASGNRVGTAASQQYSYTG